ncbi:hypothetical protein BH11VER1_BH11VER1_39240 [soil metagenome]
MLSQAQLQLDLKPKPVTATLLSEQGTIAPGKTFRVAVKLEHQATYHTYGKVLPPDITTGLPTKIVWNLPEGWKVDELPWPPTHETESTGGTKVQGYAGTVYLPAALTAPANLAAGSSVALEGRVDGLVCDPKSCMPIKLPISLTLSVGAEALVDQAQAEIFKSLDQTSSVSASVSSASKAAPKVERTLASLLMLAFVGGLILNIMPCVFPVLGIKIMSVVNQSGEDRRQVVLHGLAYTLGVLVSFWALASILLALRAAGGQIAWGFQLQSPIFVFLLTVFLFAFGLNMAGLFEVGSSAVGVGSDLTRKSGLGGSFFSGLLATVVATPCAAPFLAPALAYALSLNAIPSLLFFTVIGLGLASPYLILSLFPKLVGLLPRPGAWMESFKQAMSFLMFATAAFLVWTLAGMVDEYGLLKTLLGLVIVSLACWIYGRWSVPYKSTSTRIKAVVLSLLLLLGGLNLAWPEAKNHDGLQWQEWSPEKVQSLRDEKKPVYIDFTARWCATCQTNKLTYRSKPLQEEFKRRGIVTLKADWTNNDPRITQALADLDKAAVPVNILYVPDRKEPVMLPEILTVEVVKTALAELDKGVK